MEKTCTQVASTGMSFLKAVFSPTAPLMQAARHVCQRPPPEIIPCSDVVKESKFPLSERDRRLFNSEIFPPCRRVFRSQGGRRVVLDVGNLAPQECNAAPNLHKAGHDCARRGCHFHQLLCLHKISHHTLQQFARHSRQRKSMSEMKNE